MRRFACVLAVCGALVQRGWAQGYPYSPYSNLEPWEYETTCADIRAHCEGDVCGCALAGKLRQKGTRPPFPSGQRRNPKAECLDTHSGPDGRTCCEWKDADAPGGTSGGCTCQEYWQATEASCPQGSRGPHEGCGMRVPCDGDNNGDPGMSWCLIDKSRSDPECAPAGPNWDYCMPNANALSKNEVFRGVQCTTHSEQECLGDWECMWDGSRCSRRECDDILDQEQCIGTPETPNMCTWVDGRCSDDGGYCVERPGMASYGLEQLEDSGSMRPALILVPLVSFVVAHWC